VLEGKVVEFKAEPGDQGFVVLDHLCKIVDRGIVLLRVPHVEADSWFFGLYQLYN